MEHRHFPRKPLHLPAQLFSIEGTSYQAHVLDISAVGIRVVVNETLPVGLKVVDVLLPGSDPPLDPAYRMQMFVANKAGQVLGLCLINERARIDVEWFRQQSRPGISDDANQAIG